MKIPVRYPFIMHFFIPAEISILSGFSLVILNAMSNQLVTLFDRGESLTTKVILFSMTVYCEKTLWISREDFVVFMVPVYPTLLHCEMSVMWKIKVD